MKAYTTSLHTVQVYHLAPTIQSILLRRSRRKDSYYTIKTLRKEIWANSCFRLEQERRIFKRKESVKGLWGTGDVLAPYKTGMSKVTTFQQKYPGAHGFNWFSHNYYVHVHSKVIYSAARTPQCRIHLMYQRAKTKLGENNNKLLFMCFRVV